MSSIACSSAAAFVVLGFVVGCGDGSDADRVEAGGSDRVEVVLQPAAGAEATDAQLQQAADVVEERAAELAAADVTVEDGRIVVEVPATDDPDHVAEVVGQPGELRFRPVLSEIPADQVDAARDAAASTSTTDVAEPLAVTEPQDDDADAQVTLEDEQHNLYTLGPTMATGRVVASANAEPDLAGGWLVALEMHGGAEGIDRFNEVAAQCNPPSDMCPTGQLAIVVDSVVQSAPTIQQSSYQKDQIQISGDFSELEATDLALVLGTGALPFAVEIQPGG